MFANKAQNQVVDCVLADKVLIGWRTWKPGVLEAQSHGQGVIVLK